MRAPSPTLPTNPNRFVEEGLQGPSRLLPADPYLRAQARLVIDRFGSKGVPPFYKMLLQQDAAEQAAAARALDAQLIWLAAEVLGMEGPWGLRGGQGLTLVDCAVLPFIIRLVRGCVGWMCVSGAARLAAAPLLLTLLLEVSISLQPPTNPHQRRQQPNPNFAPPNIQPILHHYRGYSPPAAAAGRLAAYTAAAKALPAVASTMRHPAGRDYDGALIEVRLPRWGAGWCSV